MSWKMKALRSTNLPSTNQFRFSTLLFVAMLGSTGLGQSQSAASDPGIRGGAPGAGKPIAGLTDGQRASFVSGLDDSLEIQSVTGSVPDTGNGLGPRFNAESCGQCHAQPATGGTSPFTNPQITAATDQGASNSVPFFVTSNGPVREARFPYRSDLRTPDGGVHALFTISGRGDAKGCNLSQPDFQGAANRGNLIFRIPTPVFGGGLIEAIPESAILAQVGTNADRKSNLGVRGRPNRLRPSGGAHTSGNDGTVTRFGWKAQNKSLEIFAGEAYNVEMGVTNELFPNERDETPGCVFNGTPEDATNFDDPGPGFPSDVVKFTAFMRFLDQPRPGPSNSSTRHGAQIFQTVGCALCHTPSITTGQSSVTALSNVPVNLFSDLLLHHMGPRLADNISQGAAAGDEFRTSPLWGLGQRTFLLHDGRTADLVKAITSHRSRGDGQYPNSEANQVIENYRNLSPHDQQDLLNFLRSL